MNNNIAEGNHNSPPPGRRGRGGGSNFLATSSIATTPPLRGTPPPSEEGRRCAVIHEGFGLFKVDSVNIIIIHIRGPIIHIIHIRFIKTGPHSWPQIK